MKMLFYSLLAFIGGVFLAMQAGYNTQLGHHLHHPVLAVISTSFFSVLFGISFYLIFKQELPNDQLIGQIPLHLWFTGAIFSFAGITLYFYTIPKLGISRMIALGLSGQLVFSLIAGSKGWLDLPVEQLSGTRLMGAIAMILGIILINAK